MSAPWFWESVWQTSPMCAAPPLSPEELLFVPRQTGAVHPLLQDQDVERLHLVAKGHGFRSGDPPLLPAGIAGVVFWQFLSPDRLESPCESPNCQTLLN